MSIDFDTLGPVVVDDSILREVDPDDELIDDDSYTMPDPSFFKSPKRKAHAAEYEDKVKVALNGAMRLAFSHPATVADGATLIMLGPGVARELGDLAAESPQVAKAIDFITSGTTNPYIAAASVVAPLVMQVMRNHEPQAEVPYRSFKIPFTNRRLRLKFKLKLPRALRNLTNDPVNLTTHVLSQPPIVEALRKQGIQISFGDNG